MKFLDVVFGDILGLKIGVRVFDFWFNVRFIFFNYRVIMAKRMVIFKDNYRVLF